MVVTVGILPVIFVGDVQLIARLVVRGPTKTRKKTRKV
jgi:hypothetical protein